MANQTRDRTGPVKGPSHSSIEKGSESFSLNTLGKDFNVLRSPGMHVALDRIRDLRVTKKSFEKWKPMSKVTIAFVENILKSVIL